MECFNLSSFSYFNLGPHVAYECGIYIVYSVVGLRLGESFTMVRTSIVPAPRSALHE